MSVEKLTDPKNNPELLPELKGDDYADGILAVTGNLTGYVELGGIGGSVIAEEDILDIPLIEDGEEA